MKDPTRRVTYGGKIFHGKAGRVVHHVGQVVSGHTGSRAGDIGVTAGTTGISTPGQSTSEQSQHLADSYACEHATDPKVKKLCRKKDAGDFAGSFGGRGPKENKRPNKCWNEDDNAGKNSLKDIDDFDKFMCASIRRNWRKLYDYSTEGIKDFLEKQWWPQHLADIKKNEKAQGARGEDKQKYLDRRKKEVFEELGERLEANLLDYAVDSEDETIREKALSSRAILGVLHNLDDAGIDFQRSLKRHKRAHGGKIVFDRLNNRIRYGISEGRYDKKHTTPH